MSSSENDPTFADHRFWTPLYFYKLCVPYKIFHWRALAFKSLITLVVKQNKKQKLTWSDNMTNMDISNHRFNFCNMTCERYKLWNSSLWSLFHSPFSSLLGPNIRLRILFSNTPRLDSSLNVRDHVSEPYSKTGNIIVLYILIFKFLERSLEDKSVWTE